MLAINQVSKRFTDKTGNDHLAIENISTQIKEHEIVALVGTSGCGKSTLLRILSGLETPSSGEVRLAGKTIRQPSSDIAMVFQEPRLMPWLTVTENIRLVLPSLSKAEQNERINQTLHQVNLWDFRHALPRQLSGGMAQRTAIARALVCQPNILLLDEPFSALDSFTRASLQQHLLSLWENHRFTLIMVTHDIEEAAVLADRILVMKSDPGHIHKQIEVNLEHPRDRTSTSLTQLKQKIVNALDLNHSKLTDSV